MKNILLIILVAFSISINAQCTFSVIASYTPASCPSCCNAVISASLIGTPGVCAPSSWSLMPVGIGSLNGVWTNVCPGTYTVIYNDFCCLAICGVGVTSNSTGFNEDEGLKLEIDIFPNPVSYKLFISSEQPHLENSEIEIVNSLGEMIFKSKSKGDVDVSEFSNGVYFLRIKTLEQQTILKRFVVAR